MPESPMNTRAGGRLKTRNPRQQPITAPHRITTPPCTSLVEMRLIAASRQMPATIATTPAATPSAPSSKLTETCIPTSQTTVTGAASRPSSHKEV